MPSVSLPKTIQETPKPEREVRMEKVPKILLFRIKSETVVHLLEPFDTSSWCAMENSGYTWIYKLITLAANEK